MLFRSREQIEKVQMGLDPLAVVRDPDHAVIDTKMMVSLQGRDGAGLPEHIRTAAQARSE